MKLTSTIKWLIGLVVTIVLAVIGMQFGKDSEATAQTETNGNGNITVLQKNSSSTNPTQIVSIDTPAKYTSTYKIDKNDNNEYPYKVTIDIASDKNTNFPQNLCLKVNSDAEVKAYSKNVIMNVGSTLPSSISSDSDGYNACISSPTSKLIASFWLNKKPSIFDVNVITNR